MTARKPKAAAPADQPSGAAESEAAFSRILQLVRAVQNGMQNIDSAHGLSGSQLWALWHVSARPGLRVSELAEAMQIHHSTASNLLDKLERRELVRRERQKIDTRVVKLYLTDAGAKVVQAIPGPTQGRLRRALLDLQADELDGLSRGITRVLALMDGK